MKFKDNYLSYVLVYGGYYFAMAMFSVLISIYLMDLGFSAASVSFLISVSCICSMVLQPVIGMLQDRYNSKVVTVILMTLSGISGLTFMVHRAYPFLVLFYSLTLGLLNGVNPYVERMATASPYSYRSVRIWGTIGFAVGSQSAGLLYENLFPGSVYLAFFIFILASAFGVLNTKTTAETKPPENKSRAGARQILTNRKFLYYLLLASMLYAVTNLNSTYLPVLLQREGVSVSLISTITFLQTLMEFPVIFLAPYYMDRLSNNRLMGILFLLLCIQFGVYALVPSAAVQMAVSVMTKAVVTMAFVMVNLKIVSAIISPHYQLTALTLVSALSKNFTTIVMQNIGGAIVDSLSVSRLFLIMAGISLAGLLLSCLIRLPDTRREKMFS